MTTEDIETEAGTDLIGTVADWLMTQALGEARMEDLVEGCCNRLRAAGIPLWRAHIAYRTLHPLIEAISLIWQRDEGLGSDDIPHGQSHTSEAWRKSPAFHMIETQVPFLRRRLTGTEALLDFPLAGRTPRSRRDRLPRLCGGLRERRGPRHGAGRHHRVLGDRPGERGMSRSMLKS